MNIPPDLVAAADQRVAAATHLLNHLTNPHTWHDHTPDDNTLAVITLAHALQHTITTDDGITTLLAVAIRRLITVTGNGGAG